MKSNIKRLAFFLQIIGLLGLISVVNYGCDEDLEIPPACNNGDFDNIAWLQSEINRVNNISGVTGAAVESYVYNGEYTLFVIPCTNCVSADLPCILYRCDGTEICRVFEGQPNKSTCTNFANATFVDVIWEK